MSNSDPFCGTAWNATQFLITQYVYGSVILVVESIGTPFSTLTVIIFAKNVFSPSNILFTSLSISDLMVLLLGIPQLWFRISHNHIHYQLDRGSYTEIEKVADHYLATGQKIFYNISLYQTMLLAIWRYIAITHPLKERILCNVRITIVGVIIVYTLCFSYYVPVLLEIPPTTDAEIDTFKPDSNIIYDFVYIIILKTIPCIIVAICTTRFIQVLRESRIRRKEMIPNFNKELEEKEILMDRTTKMVLGITVFYLLNNSSLIVGKALVVIFGAKFKKYCFPAIYCVNNLLVLVYTVSPFPVYYVTSQQFRENFKSLFPFKKCATFKDNTNIVTFSDCADIEVNKISSA